MRARILVIDDEAAIRDSLRMILEYEGYEFIGASSGPEGVTQVEREAPDLAFLDIKMPGMDGLEVLNRLKAISDTLPVVIISGHATKDTAFQAAKLGAFDFIEKPLSSDDVLLRVRNALEQNRLRDENVELRKAVEIPPEMVGGSPRIRQVM